MGLTNVWLRTLGDGLVRADQVVGVRTHPTPSAAGKPSHWLLDVVLPAGVGGGQSTDWAVGPLHRTLIQTSTEPAQASEDLVRLLAQLDAINPAGMITTNPSDTTSTTSPEPATSASSGASEIEVRFRFSPFRAVAPDRHYDPEYL